jgi:WD40 repeat protein
LEQLREGDELVVWKLDRISRSLKDLLFYVERIGEAKATFTSLTERLDTSGPAGTALMQMLGVFAQFERSMIKERTRLGTNQVASERFFQELIVHREKALPLPIASFNHQDEVVGAAFSPDGARILTASADKTAKLWDATSGKIIASFDHLASVLHALFSPDGTRILTASEDNSAKLWDAASGKLIASFQHQNWIWHGAFSADGTRILTASADHSAKLWDAASGKLIISFDHQDEAHWAGPTEGTRLTFTEVVNVITERARNLVKTRSDISDLEVISIDFREPREL